jgi:hypothetical protein
VTWLQKCRYTDQQLILFRPLPSFFQLHLTSFTSHNAPHVSNNRPPFRIWSLLQASLHSYPPSPILNSPAPRLQQRAQVHASSAPVLRSPERPLTIQDPAHPRHHWYRIRLLRVPCQVSHRTITTAPNELGEGKGGRQIHSTSAMPARLVH